LFVISSFCVSATLFNYSCLDVPILLHSCSMPCLFIAEISSFIILFVITLIVARYLKFVQLFAFVNCMRYNLLLISTVHKHTPSAPKQDTSWCDAR
jgi:hypothetical protein